MWRSRNTEHVRRHREEFGEVGYDESCDNCSHWEILKNSKKGSVGIVFSLSYTSKF